jgi:hypothetical protein
MPELPKKNIKTKTNFLFYYILEALEGDEIKG